MSDGRIDSVINARKCNEELESVYAAMAKIAELIIKVNELGKNLSLKGFKEGFDAMKQAESGLRELNKAKEEAVRAESALQQALLESKKINQDLKNELEALRLAEAKRREEARKRKEEIKGEKGSIMDLREQLKKLLQMWDSYGAAARRANRGVLDDIKRVSKELKQLESETGRHQRNVGNYPQLVGGLKGLLGTFGVGLGAGAIAKEVFDVTVRLDSMNSALKAVSGSEAEFSRNAAFLKEEAERLGLNVLDLTQSFKNFYAAGTQAGLTANQTRSIFNSVSEVAANLKLSQQDVNGVFTAFGQIASKGKVQAEELRGQIGERIPGAFAIAARAIGVTDVQLNDMLKKGQVIATDFLPKFAKELEKTFGIDNQKKIEGLQASINRLSNAFTELVSDNQSGLSKFFTMIIDLSKEALTSINNLIGGIVYVSLKLTDKEAAQDFLNAKVIKEEAENLKKFDTDQVISQRNNVDQRIEMAQNRMEGNLAAIKSLKDAFGDDPERLERLYGSFIKRAESAVEEDKSSLKLLTLQRQALINELNRRFPAEEVTSDSTAPAKGPTKKELDAAARLREAQLKAEMEARKIDLEDAIASQKEIFENEKISWEDRLVAAENYYNLKNILAKNNADGEKKILDIEISRGRATAAQKVTVDKKAAAEQAENRRELGKILKDITKSSTDEETKGIIEAGEKRQAEIEKQGQDELAATQKLYKEGKITLDQYELEKLRIENKYQILSLQAEYEYTEQVLKLMKLRGQDTGDQEQQLLDIRNKIRDLDLDYFDKSEKKKTEITKEEANKRKKYEEDYAKRVKELREELGNAVSAVIDGIFERQKNRLQDEIDMISQRQEAEVAAVQASSASEEEKAQKIQVINAQADAQKQALERRQRQFDQQKARFDRAKSVVEIIANTGIGIAKAFADYPYFLAAPLAAVIGAIGAAQLATVLAQPIPKYKDGTEDHPGGLAHVGDGNVHEVIQAPDGRAWVTPATDTIMNIPAHYKVHPSVDDYLSAAGAATMRPLPAIDGTAGSVDKMTKAVLDGFDKQTDKILDGLERSKTSIHINNSPLGVRATVSKAAQKMRWLNQEFDL